MLEVRIQADRVNVGPRLTIAFHRTLRIPDDGRTYPLPPGLGHFPIRRVVDYADRVPFTWGKESDLFIPMYQREAMWIGFTGADWKPNAVTVEAGRVNAVTGDVDSGGTLSEPQNYLACPPQVWLDGFKTAENVIRQFVAMPLGEGYSIEQPLRARSSRAPFVSSFSIQNLATSPMRRRHGQRLVGRCALPCRVVARNWALVPGGECSRRSTRTRTVSRSGTLKPAVNCAFTWSIPRHSEA